MARTLTVQPKAARRVAQVRAGQATIDMYGVESTAPASPLEQLAQIDALIAAPDPIAYSTVVRDSGWAEIVTGRLVELEEKSAALGERIRRGQDAIARYRDAMSKMAPETWYTKLSQYQDEQKDVDEAHRNLLWQYERQLGGRVS